jgi:acyl-CoA dehydrogenase
VGFGPVHVDNVPLVQEWKAVKTHLRGRVKAHGLWGAFLDPALGGSGFSQLRLALMSEIIGRQRKHGTACAQGTDAQKERWLWPNLKGDISNAFALTEPFNAGADPTVISTTATANGD